MSVISRSLHPDLLFPGVLEIFGTEYESFVPVWKRLYDKRKGTLATERLVEAAGFGLAQVKPEAAPITYDTDREGYVTQATYTVYGIGFQVTREELEDLQYMEISSRRAMNLSRAMNATIEYEHANLFVYGFSPSVTYGDGQPMLSASHPTVNDGLQSNILATSADLSEAAIEDLAVQIMLARDTRGIPISLQADQLVIAPNNWFNASRILKSDLQNDSANNGINAIKAEGILPGGVVVNPYFGTSTGNAFYMTTSVAKGSGLTSLWRREPTLEKDNNFDTENFKAKTTCRFVPTIGDWRGVYGSQGA